MRIVTRPLPAVWPSGNRTPAAARSYSRFKASYPATLRLLERELRHLGVYEGDTVVFEAGFQEHEIRLDGLPRANAMPSDPAVILSFQSRYGPLRYGCDTYMSHDANLRAIALALEALRAVDRYGVTKRGEQYQGWKALPAAGETLTAQEAEAWLPRDVGSLRRSARPRPARSLPGSRPQPASRCRRHARRVGPPAAGSGGARSMSDIHLEPGSSRMVPVPNVNASVPSSGVLPLRDQKAYDLGARSAREVIDQLTEELAAAREAREIEFQRAERVLASKGSEWQDGFKLAAEMVHEVNDAELACLRGALEFVRRRMASPEPVTLGAQVILRLRLDQVLDGGEIAEAIPASVDVGIPADPR